MTTEDFERPVRAYFEGKPGDWAVSALGAYCTGTLDDGQPLYTGARFEQFADGANPNTFTASDVVAVSMLSVTVPPRAAIRLVSDGAANEWLRAIPTDELIWTVEPSVLHEGSASWELWHFLRNLEDVGRVTAGKLMAAKRPQLIPIYDQHVGAALRPPRRAFWLAMRRSIEDAHDLVEAAVKAAGVDVSPLRAVDIVVWMHQHGWRYSGGAVGEPPPVAGP
ncbi:MAG: DUF6308 family protein [Actinomycetota bacterium]|nr:DUF6308 family protein [Actinomycetota bacterium]